ncbi:MAG: type II methionyl aminopeptidase [Nitrospiraceae bacterium]|nr:type II methionyl aminopeptidase [Nitrospiraceae bacterium]
MEFETEFSDWIKSGKIASEIMKYGISLIKPGAYVSEILDKIEKKIIEKGAEIGFPAQMSVNSTAAHYCPYKGNDYQLKKGDVIKLDLGTSINGAIADTARTVALCDDYDNLLMASKQALKNALKLVKPGVTLSQIGKTINQAMESLGYKPIKNLTGHGLARYQIHTAPGIPNFDNGSDISLHENQIIAIEPFATDGLGFVKEEGDAGVYMLLNPKPQRNPYARKLLNHIKTYKGLPFARRWLEREFNEPELKIGLAFLKKDHVISEYPPLVEENEGMVAQFEHTMIIRNGKPYITTLIDGDDFFTI